MAAWSGMGPETRAKLVRVGTIAALSVLLFVGVAFGLSRLESYVHGLDRYNGQLALQWVDLPDWLRLDDNRHILLSLGAEAGLYEDDHLLDEGLAERIGVALSQAHIGWIKSVEQISVQPDGLVTISCQFRRPSAWVQYGQYCYLVDNEGIRLPGCYDMRDCHQSSLMVVSDIQDPPPGVGAIWPGADIASGVKMVALFAKERFRHQIERISMANHDGRLSRHRPHIELITNRNASRIKWGRPPDEEFGTEITAAQKITLLRKLHEEYGRIDMNSPYVDIRTWSDRVAMPALMQSAKGSRLLRG